MVLASDPYVWGIGRRKTAVARVRLKAGSGNFVVNGRPVDQFFTTVNTLQSATRALDVTQARSSYDVWASIEGGGVNGQADAVSLGIARALRRDHPEYEPVLREHGLMTRDSRAVERKKYGLHKARRATQFSKR